MKTLTEPKLALGMTNISQYNEIATMREIPSFLLIRGFYITWLTSIEFISSMPDDLYI